MLSLLTYTHSNASDVQQPYFSRINKYFNVSKHIILSNVNIETTDTCVVYNEKTDYYLQIIKGLNNITSDFVIYSQEDYILFDYVNKTKLYNIIDEMKINPDISFVRLIHSGIDFEKIQYNSDLFFLNNNHPYFFSTQITIWRKDSLIEMFNLSKVKTIWEESSNSIFLKRLNKIGLCVNQTGGIVGGHYNSIIYPYIATAVVRGKWNTKEYPNELNSIFDEYNIDKNKRGTNE